MKTIISAGHICLDMTPVIPAVRTYEAIQDLLVPGKLIETEHADVHTGGSVANTGLALKLLGNDVCLLGKIGDDAFGTMIQQILKSYGADGLIVDPDSSTSYSVVLALPGLDRVFLHNPGANNTFTDADIPEEVLEKASLFHFGYPPLMKRMYEDDGEELVKIFRRVKAHGIATSLDLAAVDPSSAAGRADWRKILSRVLPYVDFFVPSFEELCFMLDLERFGRLSGHGDITEGLAVEKEAAPLADELLQMGCGTVVIKCGTGGMYFRTASKEKLTEVGQRIALDTAVWADRYGVQPCFKADCIRSGTGAGDTSIAAFLTAVLQGYDPETCVALAAAEGACSVTAYDALSGLKPLPELIKRIKNGWETL